MSWHSTFTNQKHFGGFDAESDQNNFVHVHGYNVNDQGARGEQAEAFKRLYWAGSKARFWGITWYGWDSQTTIPLPSLGSRTPNYHVNVRHAFVTSRLLNNFVVAKNLGNATIFAHSLGNMVVSSAIEAGMPIARYLMVNAAVAEEAYTPQGSYDGGIAYEVGNSWRNSTQESMYHPAWRYPDGWAIPFDQGYQPKLWASEWYKLFSGGDGRATLTWRNIFARVRDHQNTYVYYAPTDEAFRPFNYTVENAADNDGYQPNVADWPGYEDVLQNYNPDNRTKLGSYAFAVQELLKGRMLPLPLVGDKDSDTGGWGFNFDDDDYWRYADPVNHNKLPIYSYYANDIPEDQLRSRPFFSKSPDYSFLYTDQPVTVPLLIREELLANELPALSFAAGHRGVQKIKIMDSDRDIDIRDKFLVKKPGSPWPRGTDDYEWKHSDIYVVAYPYLSGLYDEWAKKIQGVAP